ncbi:hypothetical protein [Mangrovimonas cancribranchiae]|uniref:YcxB-like protein domain-containing protein n=1 Tax=Mangrovimonas cancribranchiae TaxID=3080055 RepID=A0AAU6NXI8_9FLAO
MKNIITIKKISFQDRFLKSCLDFVFVVYIFFTIISALVSLYLSLFFVVMIGYYISKRYKESLIYITDILYSGEDKKVIFLYGYRDNFDLKIEKDCSSFQVERFNQLKGIEKTKIVFTEKYKTFLTQFEVGDWNNDNFEKIERFYLNVKANTSN